VTLFTYPAIILKLRSIYPSLPHHVDNQSEQTTPEHLSTMRSEQKTLSSSQDLGEHLLTMHSEHTTPDCIAPPWSNMICGQNLDWLSEAPF